MATPSLLNLTGDLRINRSASFSFQATFRDEAGVLEDISGWTFTGDIRATYEDTSPVITSFTFVPVSTGVINVTLSATDTALLPEIEVPTDAEKPYKRVSWFGIYDIFADKGGGVVDRVFYGDLECSPSVTEA